MVQEAICMICMKSSFVVVPILVRRLSSHVITSFSGNVVETQAVLLLGWPSQFRDVYGNISDHKVDYFAREKLCDGGVYYDIPPGEVQGPFPMGLREAELETYEMGNFSGVLCARSLLHVRNFMSLFRLAWNVFFSVSVIDEICSFRCMKPWV